ncbi:MAG: Tn3 family transposase [Legionellales bacterium]|nr:Tn3 family transposase [Legionellales bacterium]
MTERATNKRLTLLSEEEQFALYGLPDFDDHQRVEYLTLTEAERQEMETQDSLSAKVYFALQVGYFKAKQWFFKFSWSEVPEEDIVFILHYYFPHKNWKPIPLKKWEYYHQRERILVLFRYQPWSKQHEARLTEHLLKLVRQNANQSFLLTEIIAWLQKERMLRPTYTGLQNLMSAVLQLERERLRELIDTQVGESEHQQLQKILATETTLSELSALRQDIKNFQFRMMQSEQSKLALLKPLYDIAAPLLPTLGISKQNIFYYASLVHFHSVSRLRELEAWQTNLYLLCYAFVRYQQLTDNVAEAFLAKTREMDGQIKQAVKESRLTGQKDQDNLSEPTAKLLGLFIDDTITMALPYEELLIKAHAILPKEDIIALVAHFNRQTHAGLTLHWRAFDKEAAFPTQESTLIALIPKKLRTYLLEKNTAGQDVIISSRYEYWLYRQLRKRLQSGEFYLHDSTRHQSLEQILIPKEKLASIMPTLDLTRLHAPINETLEQLCTELNRLWRTFNRKLKKGKLPHLQYDKKSGEMIVRKIKSVMSERPQHELYERLPACDITDLLVFVEEQCQFMKAFTPLQTYRSKKKLQQGELFASILAQALNHGLHKMAQISDISYDTLRETRQQYLRLETLKMANDILCQAIEKLPIFDYYDSGFDVRYGSLDGQKFIQSRLTAKARHSKKYYGTGRGVVAYTLLCNHVPLQTEVIGAHEHESYYALDILQSNTSSIMPRAVTGDMHSINKANFGILDWFNHLFSPRFTDLNTEIKRVFCGDSINHYQKCLIKPAGQINKVLIKENWSELQRIIVTLAQKDITQSILVKKLCTYTTTNPTRKALFEYDKLIRSIYTLKYLMDPDLQRQVQRSQNRIEAYHQLRGALAEVNGKKELAGRTDVEVEVSNECGRLVANAIIYYNSAILSKLLKRYEGERNQKGLHRLKRVSPVAWQHIHLLGHYVFRPHGHGINLDEMVAGLMV